jgi:PAS domain S-box-containing protein
VLRGYSLGAVDYIFKPLDVGILRSKVTVFVDLFRKSEQVHRQAALLTEARTFLENLLESTTDYAIIAEDLAGRITGWYQGAREHYGYTADEMVGHQSTTLLFLPEDVESGKVQALLDTARSTGRAEGVFDHVRRDGGHFAASVTINVQRDADGAAIGYVLIAKDITEQRLQEQRARLLLQEQAARVEAEAANRRFSLLAAASDELTRLFDSDLALRAFAHLTLGDVAEACAIALVSGAGEIEQTVVAALDSDLESRLEPAISSAIIRGCLDAVVNGATSFLLPEISPESIRDLCPDPHVQQALLSLDFSSALIVPIPGQQHAWGALWLLRGRREPYDDLDLDFAADLARRVGLALDNVRLYREAQEAIRIREEFLSVASHELRTPITALRGQSQLMIRQLELGRAIDAERLMRAFRVIDEQSYKLARLVSRLLDISRLQVGKLVLERADCNIAQLARDAVAHIQSTTSHPIGLHSPPEIRGEVDALRLEQIITNLVDNAIKYSPDETPVQVDVSQPNAETARLAVRDWGPGIPPQHRDQIFERFHRADKQSHPTGMGLGLYISREIAELHGGRIEAEFPRDGGTRFVVTLPLHGACVAVNDKG